ncbi:PAS domain-containing sensor histidine kinase [Rhizobium leguminosarum]|uniref:PAS domain-containing sensor histidine kinase n=1 Tax=Rhizobium leguminosarum TaxID=384 RepID=UPI001C96B602|nr:PAS domain-containing sensor histidine kinase [Rhizobium leguminosarum]MBY5561703.1 PAS domain S-box protein [Rhizobium leguminosarum]MBY5621136.1 PAS domain S-box protein [Rhizobium leguminosarum]MBY5642110.1 PAS domain S-box protein [Rhizobium leguminosarum]MBY5730469.1 PAS domain S-box protein [Rhizobium leguminosarum]
MEREPETDPIIDLIPAMVWSATSEGMLDFANQHFLEFIGAPPEEISGVGFYKLFHPDDMSHLASEWHDIMASKHAREVVGRLRRADGQYRWCTLRQKPRLDTEGNVVRWYGVVLDIEDRKQAENALKETKTALAASEENLSLIINSLPVLVWSARPDGSADFVNKSWLDYAGRPADQILEWGFLDLYHPDDIPGMVDIWKRDLEHSDHTVLKGRIRGADGNYRWFYFSGRKLVDANGVVRWFGVNIDIEDLQRAENALRESEAALRESEHKLNLIINTIPAMAWSCTSDGRLEYFNRNLIDYVGLPSEEIVGFGFYRMFHPDDVEPMRMAWDDIVASKKSRPVDARIRRADGEYRWFNLRQSPLLDPDGNVVRWYGVVVDIEDRKRAEESLRQSQSDLAHVTRMTATGELAVSIAHEVNQPLMAIVTNAGTCLRWLQPGHTDLEQARVAAERIVRDGHRAGDIITSIRAMAQKLPARIELTDFKPAVREVLDLLTGELQRRGIELSLDMAATPIEVVGDRTQLQQVVLNLVMNSAEAMTASSTAKHINIRCAVEEQLVSVSVSDTGRGVPIHELERVFEAFYSTKADGIGMGLSICRSIVEAHGGRIWASLGENGDGALFTFTLPMAEGAVVHDR